MLTAKKRFPQIKVVEILECMQEMNISITEQDILKPTPSRIQKLYEDILEVLKGIPRDQFIQPNYDIMDMLEFPELHASSLPLISFYKTFASFITDLGVPNFGLKDIVRPEAKSVITVLSAVINFARFREDQLVLFEAKTQESESIVSNKKGLENANSELSSKINSIKHQRKEEEPLVEEINLVNTKLMSELKDLHKIQAGITEDIEQLKQKKTQLSDSLTNNQYLLMKLKQECQKLKSRIVESPEKLVQSIESLNLSVYQEKNAVSLLEKRSREVQIKIDSLASVENDARDCLNMIEQCEQTMKKYLESNQSSSTLKTELSQKQNEMKDLQVKDQRSQRLLQGTLDKTVQLRNSNESKSRILQDKLAKLKEEYSSISNEFLKTKAKIDANNRKVDAVKLKIQERRREHQNEIESIEASFEKLRDHLSDYMDSFKVILV